ncbi:MAG TPA: DUF222 domain-containing protein, partial [Mycobacteriales bacterium]|nr:DUF222 domain-containing protein [Mycobacteriales bacterium]
MLLVRMNADLLMGEDLKKTGAGNLFTVFGETERDLVGAVAASGGGDPYKRLRTALKADIDEQAWESLSRTESRPFDVLETGKIAIKGDQRLRRRGHEGVRGRLIYGRLRPIPSWRWKLSARWPMFERMFDSRGAVLLIPPGWDEPDPRDLGDWEPIPDEAWAELNQTPPDVLAGMGFHDQPVDEACQLPLGPHTLALLTLSPVTELSNAAKAWALKRSSELISHIEAFRSELTAALAGPKPAERKEDWAAHDVSVATRCSLYAADRQVGFARDLAGRLAATRQAMAEGRITARQAQALHDGVAHLPDELAQQIEERLLRFSHRQDLTLFKASLRRWLARLDPTWRERAETARRQVIVEHTCNDDGTGELYIKGPLEFTATITTGLTAYAQTTKPTLQATGAERKLAGLVAWAENYLTSPGAPRRHSRAISVNVTIDTPTTLGLANHPAEVIGYGLIPAQAALRLLADGSPLRKLLIDPDDGHLLHYGRSTYTV